MIPRGLMILLAALPVLCLRDASAHGRAAPVTPTEAPAPPMPRLAKEGWLFVLPVVTYAPETGLAFGASAAYQRQFDRQAGARPSSLLPVVLLTGKRQFIVSLLADAWLAADCWHLTAELGYRDFPTLFYGIGDDRPLALEESYTERTAGLVLALDRRLRGPLFVGGIIDAGRTAVRDREADGSLAAGGVPGDDGGGLRGFGLALAWDTRDAVQYPTRGGFQRLAAIRYLDVLGGDHLFTWTEATVSRYWPLGRAHVLAAGLQGSFKTGGIVPFYRLEDLGLRGYFEERHRERHVLRGQVELRSVLRGRLGGVVFAGLSELAGATDRLRLDEARPMLGCGLRFNVGGEQRVNVALDLGFGDGEQGVYVRFGEEF